MIGHIRYVLQPRSAGLPDCPPAQAEPDSLRTLTAVIDAPAQRAYSALGGAHGSKGIVVRSHCVAARRPPSPAWLS